MSRSSNKASPPAADQNRSRDQNDQPPMAQDAINPKLMNIMLELDEIEERERFLTDRVRQIKQQKYQLEIYLRMIQASKNNGKLNQQNIPRQQTRESSETDSD